MSYTRVEAARSALEQNRIRGTYRAVAEFAGIRTQRVHTFLGNRRPAASWVVNARTLQPTTYLTANCAPDLYDNPRVLQTGEEISELVTADC